jgi:hypothetical protein
LVVLDPIFAPSLKTSYEVAVAPVFATGVHPRIRPVAEMLESASTGAAGTACGVPIAAAESAEPYSAVVRTFTLYVEPLVRPVRVVPLESASPAVHSDHVEVEDGL